MSNRMDTLAGHVLLLVAVVAVTLFGYYRADAQVKAVALETHHALCAFKADIERRHEAGAAFIEDVRGGRRPPIQGITMADVEQSVANQRRTLDALSSLKCT